MRVIQILAIALCFTSHSLAQIELSYVKQQTIVGATNAELLKSARILIDSDSKISISTVAVIRVDSIERVRLRAQKSLREFAELLLLNESTDATTKITTSRYLLAGDGTYFVDAMSVSWDRTIDVVLGPPTPTPVPPEPPKPPVPPVHPFVPSRPMGRSLVRPTTTRPIPPAPA